MAMEQRQRRRPLTHQEKLALQERKQRRREKMEESRELARGPIDVTFCLLVLLLTAIGLVMLLSASFPSAYYEEKPSHHDPLYYFERQAVYAVLGTAAGPCLGHGCFLLSLRIKSRSYRFTDSGPGCRNTPAGRTRP